MTARKSALAALKKLEGERAKLDQKQRELETRAAAELGRMFLGSGMESFSVKGLKTIAKTMGNMGEEQALALLGIGSLSKPAE